MAEVREVPLFYAVSNKGIKGGSDNQGGGGGNYADYRFEATDLQVAWNSAIKESVLENMEESPVTVNQETLDWYYMSQPTQPTIPSKKVQVSFRQTWVAGDFLPQFFRDNIQGVNDLIYKGKDTTQTNTVYFFRETINDVDSGEPKTVGPLLDNLLGKNSIAVVAGKSDELDKKMNPKDDNGKEKPLTSMLHSFARKIPWRIPLENLTPRLLALITERMAGSRGYKFEQQSSENSSVNPMIAIVEDKYDTDTIQQRNAYLGKDMLEEAISRKNEQYRRKGQVATMVLTPPHFLIERLPEEELQQRRERVSQDLASKIGWENQKGPKKYFEKSINLITNSKQKKKAFETNNWNVIISGNKGVGKSLCASMVQRFLRAHGITLSDVDDDICVVKDPTTCNFAQKYVQCHKGVIVLDNAEMLCMHPKANDLVTYMDKAQGDVRVVLVGINKSAGPEEKDIQTLLRATDGLQVHFPRQNHIEIEDPTLREVCLIAEQMADERGYKFDIGLVDQMIEYLDFQNDGYLNDNGHGHLSKDFVLDAIASLVDRVFGGEASEEQGETKNNVANMTTLFASDFKHELQKNSSLGVLDEKQRIDQKISDLIGMETAKAQFEEIKKVVKYAVKTGDREALKQCRNIVVTGNAGTGKTKFAQLLFEFYKAYGVLDPGTFDL